MNSFKLNLLSVFSGFLLGFSCIFPNTYFGALFGFISVLSFWFFLFNSKKPYISLYLLGISFHFSSMWWLASTMERFGGFPWYIAQLLLVLYCLLSGLQFFFSDWFIRKIEDKKLKGISFIFSWMVLEILFPRLFPWGLGNFFISINAFSSYAEFFGDRGLSLIVLLISFFLYQIFDSSIFKKALRYNILLFLFFIIPFFIFGFYLDNSAKDIEKNANRVNALLVQGNLDIYEKGSMSFLEANIRTYQRLTKEALDNDSSIDFIVWPETVMNRWTPVMFETYPDSIMDPFLELSKPLLYGTLSYFLEEGGDRADAKMYNGSILRDSNGFISGHYAKRVLMPFGEYVPFGDIFPFIRSLVPLQGEFSKGEVVEPLKIELTDKPVVEAGVLICYEDLVSSLSRDYVKRGANVLINLTNDAWYGNSPAPYQHDLLARFRAIETRRALLRSTNTGLTTFINSRGEIEASLPLFQEAYKVSSVPLLDKETIYVKFGDYPLYGVLFFMFLYLVKERRNSKK